MAAATVQETMDLSTEDMVQRDHLRQVGLYAPEQRAEFYKQLEGLSDQQRESVMSILTDPAAVSDLSTRLEQMETDPKIMAHQPRPPAPEVDDAAAEDANGLPAGLRKRVHHPGSGECPPADATVRFEVVGRRADGTLFLSTRERLPQRWDPSSWSGSKTGPPPGPMRLSLAEPEELLPAWGHILPTMQVGEICEVAAAAPMCYGDEGHERHRISPGEPLFFQFELIDWKERRADKAELSEAARLETATELKARGTEAFKAGELTSASELYQDAADYLIDPPPPPPTETAEEVGGQRRH